MSNRLSDRSLLAIFTVFQFIDILTTIFVVSIWGIEYELNDFVRWVFSSFGLFEGAVLKMVVSLTVMCMLLWRRKITTNSKVRTIYTVTIYFCVIATIAVAGWNTFNIVQSLFL